VVTFHYQPPHLAIASALSVGSTVFLVALLIVWAVRRRQSPADEAEPVDESVSDDDAALVDR
jgi:hypothetical protein